MVIMLCITGPNILYDHITEIMQYLIMIISQDAHKIHGN